MNAYDAAERAYQNGYKQGYEDGKRDSVEVVHGRWECTYNEETGETDVTCSHCKDTRTINGCYVTTTGESCYFEDNYCPNCGAKMDGERREGE